MGDNAGRPWLHRRCRASASCGDVPHRLRKKNHPLPDERLRLGQPAISGGLADGRRGGCRRAFGVAEPRPLLSTAFAIRATKLVAHRKVGHLRQPGHRVHVARRSRRQRRHLQLGVGLAVWIVNEDFAAAGGDLLDGLAPDAVRPVGRGRVVEEDGDDAVGRCVLRTDWPPGRPSSPLRCGRSRPPACPRSRPAPARATPLPPLRPCRCRTPRCRWRCRSARSGTPPPRTSREVPSSAACRSRRR